MCQKHSRILQIEWHLTSRNPLYHPQCNGLAELFIQSFKKAVCKGLEERNVKLDDVVDQFLSVYRNTCHQTTGQTPAKLLLGRHLGYSLDLLLPPLHIGTLETSLKRNMQKSQAKQKEFYDCRSRSRKPFQIGDDVLLQQQKG